MHTIRPWLFTGKALETSDRGLMYTYEIGAILQLAHPAHHPGIESLYLPVEDGIALPEARLKQGIDFARAQIAAGRKIVIACGAGISRSTAFTMAVMHEQEHISLLDAYEQIFAVHPDALPHYALIRSLGTYFHDPAATKALFARLWLIDEPDF